MFIDAFTGTGGLTGSSGSSSTSGPVSIGGFTFAPKGSTLPAAAWVALAVVGALLVFKFAQR